MQDDSRGTTKISSEMSSSAALTLEPAPAHYALDIETECAVSSCESKGDCEHALTPATARITIACLWNPKYCKVFTDMDELARVIEEKNALLFGQNFKFDLKHLNYQKPRIQIDRWIDDTQLMAHTHGVKVSEAWLADYELQRATKLANTPGVKYRKGSTHSLKTMAPFFLGVEPFWEQADYSNIDYVTKDSKYTYELREYFLKNMTKDELSFYKAKVMPWAKMLIRAEMTGIKLDRVGLEDLDASLYNRSIVLADRLDTQWSEQHLLFKSRAEDRIKEKYAKMKNKKVAERNRVKALEKIADLRVDYQSPAQMLWLLTEGLGLDATTFEGDESTGKAVLERLAAEGRKDIATFLEWRKVNKLLTAFIPSYREASNADGCIHSSFNLAGTRTGRLSSDSPNLQQVNKELKHLFKARIGKSLITYDLSAIEAKLIAWYSEDAALYEIIEKGWSIHDYNAKVFFDLDCPVEEVSKLFPAERRAAKTCGFALFYGAGPTRIMSAFMQAGFVVSKSEARAMYKAFRQAFSGAFDFHEEVTRRFEAGDTILNAVGRPIKIQEWENPYMQGFNRLIQSSASDINLDVALNVCSKSPCIPLLFVHDSITVECDKSSVSLVEAAILKKYESYTLSTDRGTIKITGEGGAADEWK